MKTVTYNDILFRAAELAGRTRDRIPVSEALMLQTFLATELEDVWSSQCWPELVADPVQVTPAATAADGALEFPKNEGQAGEMGEILGVWTNDPRVTTKAREVEFEDRDDAVWVPMTWGAPVANGLWVEYMLPSVDLNALSGSALAAQTIPQRFRNYLSLLAGAELKEVDVEGSGTMLANAADRALAKQIRRLPAPPWWRANVRVRNSGRRHGC